MYTQSLISETPFLAPATRHTGPVEVPVAVDASVKHKYVDPKDKKKSHKSRKDKPTDKIVKTAPKVVTTDSKPDQKRGSSSEKKRDRSVLPVSKPSTKKQGRSSSPPADTSSGSKSAH